ncbi:hypothetical protein HIM_02696 [Hirsutella minnesotensis 3608]|nr:hypothetical protein HIM_02696 [Hirsutella minnesotensis 3608]
MREKKKRGKASRKDLAQRATAASAAASSSSRPTQIKPQTPSEPSDASKGASRASSLLTDSCDNGNEYSSPTAGMHGHQALGPAHGIDLVSQRSRSAPFDIPLHTPTTTLDGYTGLSPEFDEHHLNFDAASGGISPLLGEPRDHAHFVTHDTSFDLAHQSRSNFENDAGIALSTTTTVCGFPAVTVATSPGWGMAMASPPASHFQTQHSLSMSPCFELRYPVLEPLVPHLMDNAIMTNVMACDLLDFYFSSSSSAQLHPVSPYVLGFVLRKKSVLQASRPRACQPALLASMLWVAAQTSDAAVLTSSPSARANVSQRLLDLTLRLLKPLIHASIETVCSPADATFAGFSLGGLNTTISGSVGNESLTENDPLGGAGQLDDVMTYIHLATVASASEYKGASLRWWNAAWSLARELKLGRELAPNPSGQQGNETHGTLDVSSGVHICGVTPGFITEEEREERRRTWWLLYMVDRHLALCFNRPLSLLDVECEGLLIPVVVVVEIVAVVGFAELIG